MDLEKLRKLESEWWRDKGEGFEEIAKACEDMGWRESRTSWRNV